MNQMRYVSAAAILFAASLSAVPAQDAPAKLDRVIGEITALDAAAKQLTIKPDSGAIVTALADEKTSYLRVPPGEKDLKKATRVTLEQTAVGDRVLVRGHMAADQKSMAAVAVIIMTKAELAQKHERDREEWRKRGLAGPVTAVNPDTKEITISTRTREGPKPVVIEAGGKVDFVRYAPDSVRYSDAKPGTFADFKAGDQLRVLGEKNADGTRVIAEAIVSGSFRNVAGAIRTVDASANQITLTDLVSHKPVTIHVTTDTAMHRLPPWMGTMLARASGSGGGSPGGGGSPAGAPRPEGFKRDGPPAAGGPAGPPGAGGMRRGGMDFQDMLERMPPLTLAELKPGDAIMLSATNGPDAANVTAINLLAGVEPLLTAAPQGGQQIFGSWNFDMGMPQ